MTQLTGLKFKLDRPVDKERRCCRNVCVIDPGKGPHAGALRCADCGQHRGWLSKATAQWIEHVVTRFGAPTTPIIVRKAHTFEEEAAALQHAHEQEFHMKREDVFPSRFLKSEDIKGKPITAVIENVEKELIGQGKDQKEKPVMYFKGDVKEMVVNATNWDRLRRCLRRRQRRLAGRQGEDPRREDVVCRQICRRTAPRAHHRQAGEQETARRRPRRRGPVLTMKTWPLGAGAPGGLLLGQTAMDTKPQTYNGDLGKLPAALEHLREQKAWVCWCWWWNGKKWTKPPRRSNDPECNASSSDPDTWGTYERAVAQVHAGKADGIGFALKGRDIGGIDLDHCRDPETGAIDPRASEYLHRFPNAYVEATVSGKGLRILGTSTLASFAPKFKLPNEGNGAAVELFSNSNHYLTLSCNEITHCATLPPIGDEMRAIATALGACTDQEKIDFDAEPRANDTDAAADDETTQHADEAPANGTPWSFAEEARLRAALGAIPTNEKLLVEKFGHSHSIWVKIGRAIERRDWGKKGFAIWRDWSSQSPEYDEKGLLAQWASFRRNRGTRARPTTIATVYRYAMKFEWSNDRPDQDENEDDLVTANAGELKMCGVEWLWPGRFARGKFGLIAGMPDMGKGQIAAFVAAAVTAAIELPCDEGTAQQGNVIWFNAEDGARDTVLPRAVAAGADPKRIFFVNGARVGGVEKMFSLVTDLQLLRAKIKEIGNVVLVIIDPVSAYLGVGKVDGRSATDVRGVLTPLKDMAEELHIAVIGIAHFNKKDDIKSALLRVSDSIAYVAAARHVYAVLDDPEDKNSKLFVKAKNNLAPDKKALRYGMGVKTVGHDERLKVITAPFIVWHPQHVEITANEAMAAAGGHSAKREAREFLLERLETGPVKQNDILDEAKQEGIAEKTLRRAKKDLGVKSRKERGKIDGEWLWELSKKATFHPQRESWPSS
jgi:hypothetical protein